MKITYLHQYFNTPQDSGGTRSYEMARRLVAAGHNVTMVTSARNAAVRGGWFVTTEAGISVHWLPVPYSNQLSYAERIRAFFRFAAQAAQRAAQIPADVLFATSTPLTIALPAVCASKRQNAPMVFEVRDLWPELPIAIGALRGALPIAAARQLERFAYQNAAAIVALSPGMKAGVVDSGYPAEKVTVIPNSCDIDLFTVAPSAVRAFRAQYEWLQDRPLVLYAGTLGLINGAGYMAEIAATLLPSQPEVCFLVVGDGMQRSAIEEKSRALGVLNRNFYMLDRLPKQEMPVLFGAADISTSLFVDLPEMWANSANKFFDGLASGACIAINYQGWQAELLAESGAGFVLPPADPQVAAALLAQALDNPGYLQRAGAAALALARSHFDRDMLAAQLEQVLAGVAAGGSSRQEM